MNISLGIYEFHKLLALVNGICLSVLTILFAVFANRETVPSLTFIIGILFVELVACCLMQFIWFTKAERALLDGEVRLWTTKRIAIALFFPLACALAGIYTMFFYTKIHITILMMIILAGYLGFDLGNVAKIAVRYRRRT